METEETDGLLSSGEEELGALLVEVPACPLDDEKKPELEDGGSCSGISICDLEVLISIFGTVELSI